MALILDYVLGHGETHGSFSELRIRTDGRLLNTQISEIAAAHAGVDQTWILHGNGAEGLEREVQRNVDFLLGVRHDRLRVVPSWMVDGECDPQAFVEMWAGRLRDPWIGVGQLPPQGDGVWFRRSDHDHFEATRMANERLQAVADQLGLAHHSSAEDEPRRCPGVFSTPTVAWDGDITLCPWDLRVENKVGEVTSDRLSRVWLEDPGVQSLRQSVRGRGVPGTDLCRDCHFVYSPNYRQASQEELKR